MNKKQYWQGYYKKNRKRLIENSKKWHKEHRELTTKRTTEYRRNLKNKIMIELGGAECIRCGYNKCIASLDFHHISDKRGERDWRSKEFRKFLDKLVVLCKNCHSELHYKYGKDPKKIPLKEYKK